MLSGSSIVLAMAIVTTSTSQAVCLAGERARLEHTFDAGGTLDLFARSEVRRVERALLQHYEVLVDALTPRGWIRLRRSLGVGVGMAAVSLGSDSAAPHAHTIGADRSRGREPHPTHRPCPALPSPDMSSSRSSSCDRRRWSPTVSPRPSAPVT